MPDIYDNEMDLVDIAAELTADMAARASAIADTLAIHGKSADSTLVGAVLNAMATNFLAIVSQRKT